LRRRGSLTLPRVALSAAASVVLLVAAGAAGYGVWRLALLIDPAQASALGGEPYRPVLYRLAMLLAGLAAVLSVFALVRRRLGAVGLAVGMLVVLALAGVFLAFTLPGVSGAVVQPALVVAIGAVMAVLLPEPRTAARSGVYLLALAFAAILLGPAVWIGFDIGLNVGPLSVVLLAMFVTLALPLTEAAWPLPAGTVPRRRVRIAAVPVLLVVLTAMVTAAGLVANREGATDTRQEAVAYSLDPDTKKARWASGAKPASDWSRSLLSEPAVPLEESFPWSAGAALWHGPAPAAELSPPAVMVLSDVNRGGIRELTLRLSSRRGASTLGLWVDAGSATVRSASVAGRAVPTDRSQGKWAFGFRFYGAPVDGVEVRLGLDQNANDVVVRVADSTHDLAVVAGFTPPPGRVLMTPEVVVTRALTL
jgi:hypothetical protein